MKQIYSNRQGSDRDVLSTAYFKFKKGLKSYALYKISDQETSDDLVQNTFVKTWNFLAKGGKVDSMKAFLYHILNNLIVDEYRRRKNKTIPLEILLEKGFDPSTDDSDRILNILDGKSAVLLIKRLPARYQKVMRMKYVEDLSLEEMSRITKQTKNTMAVQGHRGLEKLKFLYKRD